MAESFHAFAKRVSAHGLRDGKYLVIEDEIRGTRYGTARSLAVQHTVPETVLTWVPKSTETPAGSLVGRYFEKRTLVEDNHRPCHGVTYVIEFPPE
jgi:hypothetical protein